MDFSYYALKIFTSFILPPGLFILLFFIAILFMKRFKKIFLFFAIIFYLLSTKVVGNFLISQLENLYSPLIKVKPHAVIVLGNGTKLDSPNLPLTRSATKRVLYALMLSNKTNLPLIFLGTQTESTATKKTIEEISKSFNKNFKFSITYHAKASNTKQSAKLLKNYLKTTNTPIYLVTSASHMIRAKKYFLNEGFLVVPSATDYMSDNDFCYCWLVPSMEGLKQSEIFIYELLGILKDTMKTTL